MFKIYDGRDAALVLADGSLNHVEVYRRDGRLHLGAGWSVVVTAIGACAGDVVFFCPDGMGRIHARFFDSAGHEPSAS
ncbi:hypothetical protein ACP70R_026375 [Stipagrostis hirtigluma subsp. patula]